MSPHFGQFTLDQSRRQLLKEGEPVHLSPKAFQLLSILVENTPRAVSKNELQEKLWPDTFVSEGNLACLVTELRSALGDDRRESKLIRTLYGFGYSFVASVADRSHPSEKQPAAATHRPLIRWTTASIAAVLGAAGIVLIASRDSSPGGAELSPIRSIVVLPLKNLSNDPEQQYFADGMTEELITRLAGLEGLRVISRTSAMKFRDTEKLLPRIASELKVDAVLTGSVLHSGNRVRISAQLLHAASDRYLWAESYEGDERDVLQLQNEVAQQIADEIRLELRPAGAATARRARPIDPEAHRAYLLGRYRWHTRRSVELEQAVEDFKRAIAIDPSYARAYAGLADVDLVMPLLMDNLRSGDVLPKAKEAAEKALELDPTLPEAHNSNAYVKMYLDWDFAAAERGFRKAIELNPNYATAHQWYAELLSLQGRHNEARTEIGIALELDPLSAVMHHQAGQCYQQARRYDDALQEYKNANALDPAFERITAGAMFWAYARKGMAVPALESLMKALTWKPEVASQLRTAAVNSGVAGYHRKHLELSKGYRPSRAYYAAIENAAVKNDDAALYWLDQAYRQREGQIFFANVDPEWDHLRSDPRFIAVLEKVGLAGATDSVQPVPRVHRETRRPSVHRPPRSVVLKNLLWWRHSIAGLVELSSSARRNPRPLNWRAARS